MLGNPLVTIAVPAYNAAVTLPETLDSLLRQSYANLEIIVSDNHSTDSTTETVKRYANSRLSLVTCPAQPPASANKLEISLGAVWNYNSLLTRGQGEFLAIYHADDVYDSDIVEKQVSFLLRHDRAGAVFTMARMIDTRGRPLRVQPRRLPSQLDNRVLSFPELLDAIMQYGSFLMTPTLMARRAVLQRVGGLDPRTQQAADYDWWLRIARDAGVGVIGEELFSHRVGPHQDSRRGQEIYRASLLPLFGVIDGYLSLPGITAMVSQDSLNAYRVAKARDTIRLARNLLADGKLEEGRAALHGVIIQLLRACSTLQARTAASALDACLLLASAHLGCGQKMACWQNDLTAWGKRVQQREQRAKGG